MTGWRQPGTGRWRRPLTGVISCSASEEQRVFRWLSVFPAPFTLEGAEAVAGATAGPVALRLVDCSLLAPPRTGPDGRARYLMMDTLRAYGAGRLADAGERPGAAAALARYALQVAEQAAAGLQTGAGELAAAQWLDAEDATVHQVLAWALQHDPATALRLAIALAPWWQMRGRMVAGYALLRAAAGHAAPGSDAWCAAHYWLGHAAESTGDFAGSVGYFTAVCDAVAGREPSPVLVDALAGRSVVLLNIDRVAEGIEDARRAVALAREMGYPAGEALALANLGLGAYYAGDLADAVAWARQAQRIDPAGIPGWIARRCNDGLMLALLESGDVSSAWQCGADGLVRARRAGDLGILAYCLGLMADMDQRAGRISEAGVHLRESLEIATRMGDPVSHAQLPGHRRAPVRRNAALGRGRHAVGGRTTPGTRTAASPIAAGRGPPPGTAAESQASAGARPDPRSRAARRRDDA